MLNVDARNVFRDLNRLEMLRVALGIELQFFLVVVWNTALVLMHDGDQTHADTVIDSVLSALVICFQR